MNFLWFPILACCCNKNNTETCCGYQTKSCSRTDSRNSRSCADSPSVTCQQPYSECPASQNQESQCSSNSYHTHSSEQNQNCSREDFQTSPQNQGYSCQQPYPSAGQSVTEPCSSCHKCN